MSLLLLVGTTVRLETFSVDIFQNIKNTIRLHMDERSLMNSVFEDILNTSSVDYSCNEIEDIQSAVLEMLERIAVKINERGLFNISRIEPCGSMAEKTALWKTDAILHNERGLFNISRISQCGSMAEKAALWKTDTEDNEKETISEKYLEFDFLAVLAKTDDIEILMQDCKGCTEVHGNVLNKYGSMLGISWWYVDMNTDKIDQKFRREVGESILSLCNCWTDQERTWNGSDFTPDFDIKRKFDHLSAGCTECSICRASGTLEIAPGPCGTRYYTLILQWESKSSSLFAPVGYSINQTQNMKRFLIHIDFIAAFETKQEAPPLDKQAADPKCFIIPKLCRICRKERTWRISGCIEEIRAIKNEFSMKHKKCYMILKYIFQTGRINNYTMKTVVLNHHTTCTDTSEDMVACVTTILQELCDAHKRWHLQAYCRPVNLLRFIHGDTYIYTMKFRVLDAIDELDSFKPYRHPFENLFLKDIL